MATHWSGARWLASATGFFALTSASTALAADAGPSREAAGLAALERACSGDRARLVADLANVLGVRGLQVHKAIGRHLLASPERGDLCTRGDAERRAVIAASREPKKSPSESPKQWLLEQLEGPTGEIDHAAVVKAFDEREDLIIGAAEKRAGLPLSAPSGWTNLTGYTQSAGRINHVLFTSGTGNDILAAADGGGIWRTTNAGASWTFVNDFFGSLSIANFARAGNDANVIYAGTNARGSHTYFPFGILKSIDGGATWSQLAQTNPSTNADFKYVQRVAVHPSNSSIVLAATESGAYQSIDGGSSWTKVGAVTTRAYDVAFHPSDGNRRAVAYDDGTLRYTTTGDLLGAGAATTTVLAGGHYMKLAYARSDTSRMYALISDSATGNTRLWKSITGGASFAEITSLPDTALFDTNYLRYTGGLWVDPTNADSLVLFEGWAAYTSNVSAATPAWKNLYSGWVDFHGVVEHPAYNGSTNRIVYFMDDGGLYRVSDVTAVDLVGSFTRLDTGMAVTEVYSVSGFRGNPIFGAQDVGPRVYRTDPSIGDNTSKWRFLGYPSACPSCQWKGDGFVTAASRTNASLLYGERQYLDLIRSTDGGATGVSIVAGSALNEGQGATAPNYNAGFLAPFALDPSNERRMLAGGLSLWRTTNVDSGSPPTWTSIRGPYTDPSCGSTSAISVIAIAPSNPDIVWIAYYGCTARVFKSANATQASPSFTEVALPVGAQAYSKATITIDRTNPNVVWLGLFVYKTGTLYKTTDGGATPGAWSQVPGLPGAPVYSLLQHPANPSWLFAGTGVGLFASTDGGATWSPSNDGPANVVVRSLAWNTTGPVSELLVGTFGRGVWKVVVPVANSDVNADTRSDVLYRNFATGQVYRFLANGFSLASGAMAYTEPNTAWKVVADADFNGDGVTDLLWRNDSTGQVYVMPFAATGLPSGGALIYTEANSAWKIVHTPDLDGDGRSDLLWWNSSTGQVYAMLFNGTSITAQGLVYTEPDTNWKIVAVGDFAGSGKRNQLLWRNATTGLVFLMTVTYTGSGFTQAGQVIYQEPNTAWKIIAAADFNGDGRADLLWRNDTTGQVYMMLMNGGAVLGQGLVYTEANSAWRIVAAGDYDGDGKADLLWRNEATGQVFMMLMNGLAISGQALVYQEANLDWKILGTREYGLAVGLP